VGLVKCATATLMSILLECLKHDVAFDAMPPSPECNTVHDFKRASKSVASYWSVVRRIQESPIMLILDAFAARATSTWQARKLPEAHANCRHMRAFGLRFALLRAAADIVAEVQCVSDDVRKPDVDASSSEGIHASPDLAATTSLRLDRILYFSHTSTVTLRPSRP
jgi:hypothetical protein